MLINIKKKSLIISKDYIKKNQEIVINIYPFVFNNFIFLNKYFMGKLP